MERDEEAVLVRRVARGDRGAFSRLLEEHQKPLLRYTRRMLQDAAMADDIVQETFLRLWSRAADYNSAAGRLSTWLHQIAHNLCIDSFRRNARISFGEHDEDEGDAEMGPERREQGRERSVAVQGALALLGERQRSALILCHYQGLSNRDAAQILDVSVDALESLLARARRRLRTALEGLHES